MKALAFILLALCGGCSWSGVTRKPDGTVTAYNARFAWQTVGFKLTYTTNFATIELQQSNPDAQVAEAIARGVAQGIKP